jgi:glycosyltransferase involved in cell wall biosynthesis
MPVRVLHVTGSLGRGGVETWLMHVLRNIDRQAYQMDFCCLARKPGAFDPEVQSMGSRIIRPEVDVNLSPLNLYRLGRWFKELLRTGRYDVVHSHVFRFSGLLLWLAHTESVPVRLAHLHTTQGAVHLAPVRKGVHGLLTLMLKQYCTQAFVISERVAKAVFGDNWRANPKCKLLYYGLDFSPFAQSPNPGVKAQLGIPADSVTVGHVGNFTPPKNHRFLVEIFRELQSHEPSTHLLLVGGGELEAEIRAQVERCGLGSRVTFAGVRNDVPLVMTSAMDAFVFPSIYEGLGVAAVEAQAAGLRCVLSDRLPHDVAVVAQATRFVSLSEAPKTWAQHVVAALAQGPMDRRAALAQVENSRFGLEHCLRQVKSAYDEAHG